MIVSKETLKSFFKLNDVPTADQFASLIDSMRHINDFVLIPQQLPLTADFDSAAMEGLADGWMFRIDTNSIGDASLERSFNKGYIYWRDEDWVVLWEDISVDIPLGEMINSATEVDETEDGSMLMLWSSVRNVFNKIGTTNFIAQLKAYFDELYNNYTLEDKAVSLAKMADVATKTVFYRKTYGSGTPEVQTLETLKTDLNILQEKPVLSICSELPTADLTEGDRYFVIAGELAMKIAEWTGSEWISKVITTGKSFYSYTQKNFIVRTPTGYDVASGSVPFVDNFTSDVINEVLIGNRNGLNRIFRTSNTFLIDSIVVFLGGLKESDFDILDNETIQFGAAPNPELLPTAVYKKVII
ncbi:MAG: hypothetical protein NTZ33_14535 [Bacteroidetes bacterium]|nr:hypothetical protein [Bacteroidota bacterium]